MRIALSSSALSRALAAGDLTQLEFLDLCAATPGADGAVLDLAHFPRRDSEYLAQLKKFAADLALTLVAVRDDDLPCDAASPALSIAAEIGAPYVLSRMPEGGTDPVTVYDRARGVLGEFLSEAKRRNVTIAVRNVAGSLAADAFTLSRLRKETDSAWLRFALDLGAWPEPLDEKIRKRVVLAYCRIEGTAVPKIIDELRPFAGFVCLDYDGRAPEVSAVRQAVAHWQKSVAEPRVPS